MHKFCHFECPYCGTHTKEMKLVSHNYIPTTEDLDKLSRFPEFKHIGSEILQCKCGRSITWFDMKDIWEYQVPALCSKCGNYGILKCALSVSGKCSMFEVKK